MASWHKRVRLGVAVFGLAVAAIVYFAMGDRQVTARLPPVPRVDQKAISEVRGGTHERTVPLGVDRQVTIEYDLEQIYEDGSIKWTGVRSIRVRRGEKEFIASAGEARVGPEAKEMELTGDVKMQTSDGFQLATDHATYNQDENVARAPGAVTFSKGRMSGSGIGISYDEKTEVLTIAEQAHVVTRDEAGATTTELTAAFATLDRMQDLLLLNNGAHVTRGSQVIDARDAVANLSPDEDVITFLKLMGDARVTGAGSSIDAMNARDIDLDYTDDGATLERVAMRGGSAIAMTGQNGAPGRQIQGNTLDLTLGPDGSLLRAIGKERVQLDLPAAAEAPSRSIRSAALDARGQAGRGLTEATFTGDVVFEEAPAGGSRRTGRAQALHVSLANDAVTSATFTGRASFEEQGFNAAAHGVDYRPDRGALVLTSGESGPAACVADSQVNVDAQTIDVTLQGHTFSAKGNVTTVLRGESTAKPTMTCGGRVVTAAAPRAGEQPASRLPGLLDQKASATVTSDTLDYKGAGGTIVYTGMGQPVAIVQGPTSVRGARIVIDQANGDLIATDKAVAALLLDNTVTVGNAHEIRYTDAKRLVTFAGSPAAPLVDLRGTAQGNLLARRIEIVLAKGESKAERIDASRDVTVTLDTRKVSKADSLEYRAADGRYELKGNPLVWVEKEAKECRESSGTMLEFWSSGTRGPVLDGQQQRLFLSQPKQCPAFR